ncbi:MAG: effector binding domain-containing protein [Methanimicrococcus sp.]|nr:effector binding domain-containing protein [Methanimicrococcus sp.]
MDIRFETKNSFYVSGYPTETTEASLEKDCAILREKYESKLRSVSNRFFFASYMSKDGAPVLPMTDGGVMIYLFGVEAGSQTPVTEGATCIAIPAARFAVAAVPKGAPILAAWHEFFEKGIPEIGAEIDMNYMFYFEAFDENGACELWIPVK